MTTKSNKKELKRLRQDLRNNMPPAEAILWNQLKGKQLDGYKFRRQHSIDNFVLDFFCPEGRLAIEIDGDSHYGEGHQNDDAVRQQQIESHGITIIRFTNTEIYDSLDGVVDTISRQLTGRI